MKGFMEKIINNIAQKFKHKDLYMRLISVNVVANDIICEFNDGLNLNGKLIKISLDNIFNDKKIQSHISPQTLLLIGSLFGIHKNIEKNYKVTLTDLLNNTLVLENNSDRIKVKFRDLIDDIDLMSQINPKDLVRWLSVYYQKEAYSSLSNINKTLASAVSEEKIHNIVNICQYR